MATDLYPSARDILARLFYGFRVALLADSAQSESVQILNFARLQEAPPATATLPAEAAGLKPVPPPAPVTAIATTAPQPGELTTKPKQKPFVMPPLSPAAPDAGSE